MDNMETLPFWSQEFPDEYMLNDEFSPATTVVTPSPLPGKEAPTITPDRIEPLCRGLAVQFEKVIEEKDKTFEACPDASASTGPQGVETNKEDTEKISQPTMEEKKVSLQVEADQKGSAIEGEAPCSSGTQPGFEKPDATSTEPDITIDPVAEQVGLQTDEESRPEPETTKEPTVFFDKPETSKDHQPEQTMTSPAQVNPGIFEDSLPGGVAPEGEMDPSDQLQPDIKNHDQPQQEASEVKDAKPVAEHPQDEDPGAESDMAVEVGSPSLEEQLDAGMEADSKAPVVLRRDQYAQKKENNPPGRRGRPPKKDGEKAKPRAKAKAKARGEPKAKAKGKAKAKASRATPSRAVQDLGKTYMGIDMIIPPTPAPPRVPEVVDNLVPPPAKPAEEIKPEEPKRRSRKRVASAPAALEPAEAAPSSSSSLAPTASEPSKKRKNAKKDKRECAHGADGANPNADGGEIEAEENKVKKNKGEKNKGKDEGDDKGETKVKSFARRPFPKTNPAQIKWCAIRDHFKENVSPELAKFLRFPGKLEDQGVLVFFQLPSTPFKN